MLPLVKQLVLNGAFGESKSTRFLIDIQFHPIGGFQINPCLPTESREVIKTSLFYVAGNFKFSFPVRSETTVRDQRSIYNFVKGYLVTGSGVDDLSAYDCQGRSAN